VAACETAAAELAAELEGVGRENVALGGRLVPLERCAEVAAMAAWLPHAEVPLSLLISVVMPTRDRRHTLGEAIESVERQSYTRWELIVVNDGSQDGTAEFLSEVDDPRVRVLETDGAGPCGARNAALDVARGDVVAYLDDDNLFDRHWLKAIAWTFDLLPKTQVCYGARVFDDEGRAMYGTVSGRPGIHLLPWDEEAVLEQNLTDMNVMAHRRCELRFDEELPYYGDWHLLLQLTQNSRPVELPAVAAYYRTHLAQRISSTLERDEMRRQYARVREKVAAAGMRS
jgi:glycosyltransferase involved in cell wall biosynthesis